MTEDNTAVPLLHFLFICIIINLLKKIFPEVYKNDKKQVCSL